MVVSDSGVLKAAVVIPAVQKAARMQSLIPDDALYPMEYRLSTLGRTAAAAQGFLDPKSP